MFDHSTLVLPPFFSARHESNLPLGLFVEYRLVMTSYAALDNGQVSNLRPITRFITTHREDGKAIAHSGERTTWQNVRNNEVGLSLLYATSEFPCQLDDHEDIKIHERIAKAGPGLVSPGGSLCRIVDFAPGNDPQMHRTQSLDYGVVLEGEMEMILDSGEAVTLKRGDVAVQRATMHAWKNTSNTEWARMLFVLLQSNAPRVGGEVLGASLGDGMHELSAGH